MSGSLPFGAQSMTAPLAEVLVKRPGPAFGAAFDDPAHGFLHPVDLSRAQREHDAFVETLASLGRQTMTDWEAVVVDDCSTDATREVVAAWPDPRVRLVTLPENGGPVRARNRRRCIRTNRCA